MTNIQFLLLSIVVLSAGIVMLNWRVSRAHRRIDEVDKQLKALRSKQNEHDRGFHRTLDWHPDEGGIVRVRAKVVRMRFGKRGTIYEQDQAG